MTTFIAGRARIFVAMDAAVLALGDLTADGLAVIDLAAVGAEIEPAGVGILRHHAVGGPMKRALSCSWWRGTGNFSTSTSSPSITFSKIGPVVDEAGRQRLHLVHAGVIVFHDVDLALEIERRQRQGDAARRGELPIERAVAFRVARELSNRIAGAVPRLFSGASA